MATTFELVAGWTAPVDAFLLQDGETPSTSLSGSTIALVLRKTEDGSLLDTSGDVAIQDADAWRVRYSPDASDLVPGKYKGRFKVTDSGGKIGYYPSAEWDTWIVRSES